MENAQEAYAEKMARRDASLARKVERRTEWAEKAEARSLEAYNASNQAVAGIEFGQPILIGHHSQRRHENAIKRAQKSQCRASPCGAS